MPYLLLSIEKGVFSCRAIQFKSALENSNADLSTLSVNLLCGPQFRGFANNVSLDIFSLLFVDDIRETHHS